MLLQAERGGEGVPADLSWSSSGQSAYRGFPRASEQWREVQRDGDVLVGVVLLAARAHVVQVDVGIHLAELGAQVDVQVTQRAGLVREAKARLCLVRRDVRRLRLLRLGAR